MARAKLCAVWNNPCRDCHGHVRGDDIDDGDGHDHEPLDAYAKYVNGCTHTCPLRINPLVNDNALALSQVDVGQASVCMTRRQVNDMGGESSPFMAPPPHPPLKAAPPELQQQLQAAVKKARVDPKKAPAPPPVPASSLEAAHPLQALAKKAASGAFNRRVEIVTGRAIAPTPGQPSGATEHAAHRLQALVKNAASGAGNRRFEVVTGRAIARMPGQPSDATDQFPMRNAAPAGLLQAPLRAEAKKAPLPKPNKAPPMICNMPVCKAASVADAPVMWICAGSIRDGVCDCCGQMRPPPQLKKPPPKQPPPPLKSPPLRPSSSSHDAYSTSYRGVFIDGVATTPDFSGGESLPVATQNPLPPLPSLTIGSFSGDNTHSN